MPLNICFRRANECESRMNSINEGWICESHFALLTKRYRSALLFLKMKTLFQLAFEAVPNPGLMAEIFLVPWHPIAKELQERQYADDRNRYREEH